MAIPSAGNPTATNTSIRIAIPPLGIPGVPIADAVVNNTMDSIWVKDKSTPITCRTKDVTLWGNPNLFICSILAGRQAALEHEVNANTCTGRRCSANLRSGMRDAKRTIRG